MKVGDFGAGTGHYARAAAHLVGPSGRVYAVDVQEDILKHLKLNTHDSHQSIIETVWGDIERLGGTHLKDALLDVIILGNVLFQMDNRPGLVSEIKRVLKPGGSLAIIDWSGSFGGLGPKDEFVVSAEAAEALFATAGFTKIKSFPAGAHHYGLLLHAPS